MVMPRFAFCLAVIFFWTSSCLAQAARDRELAEKLVGAWVVPAQQYHDAPAKHPVVGSVTKFAMRTFRANGTFTFSAVLTLDGRDVPLHNEGKWRVQSGVLIEEVTKSNQPTMIHVGLVTRDQLISVTETEYRYRTEGGEERYRVRKR
jgi:hypothetical protein